MMRAISRNFGFHAPKIPPYHLPTPIMQGRPSQNRVRPQLVVLYVLPLDATQYTSVNVSAVYTGSRGDFSRAASGTGRAAFPLATPFYNTTTVTTSTGDGTCSQRSVAVRFQPSMGDRIFLGWQVTGLTSRRDTDPWTLATRDNRRTYLLWRMGGGASHQTMEVACCSAVGPPFLPLGRVPTLPGLGSARQTTSRNPASRPGL